MFRIFCVLLSNHIAMSIFQIFENIFQNVKHYSKTRTSSETSHRRILSRNSYIICIDEIPKKSEGAVFEKKLTDTRHAVII